MSYSSQSLDNSSKSSQRNWNHEHHAIGWIHGEFIWIQVSSSLTKGGLRLQSLLIDFKRLQRIGHTLESLLIDYKNFKSIHINWLEFTMNWLRIYMNWLELAWTHPMAWCSWFQLLWLDLLELSRDWLE